MTISKCINVATLTWALGTSGLIEISTVAFGVAIGNANKAKVRYDLHIVAGSSVCMYIRNLIGYSSD